MRGLQVQAQDKSQLDKARAEGKASFYANITAVEPIMKAFTADTGVKGEYTRISTTKFVATAITEFEAGKLMADVVQGPVPVLELLKEKGVLASYRSPAAAGYPEWARKDDQIMLFGIEYVGLIYNKERVKPADVPTRYEDLTLPKWKDKIVMANPANHATTIAWLIGLKENVFKSEADWRKFLKGLAANKPMFVSSFGPTPAPIESGEKLIGISMPKYIVTKAPAPARLGAALAAADGHAAGHRGDRQGAAPGRRAGVRGLLAVERNPWACWRRTSANTCWRPASSRPSTASTRPRSSPSANCRTRRPRSGAPSSSRSST